MAAYVRNENSEQSVDLRLRRLEAAFAAERGVYEKAILCDYGPYPSGPVTSSYAEQATFITNGKCYSGRSEIYRFYRELLASHTLHFFTNCWIEPAPDSDCSLVHCYGFETPTIRGEAVFGLMNHDAVCRTSNTEASWENWKQEILVLTPVLAGWGARDSDLLTQSEGVENGI